MATGRLAFAHASRYVEIDMQMPPPDAALLARRPEFVSALRAIVPGEGVIDDDAELAAYECDGLTAYRQRPMIVVLPETVDQVSRVLAYCHREGLKVVPRGAGTSLSGGSLPLADGIILGMGKFNRVLQVDYDKAMKAADTRGGYDFIDTVERQLRKQGRHWDGVPVPHVQGRHDHDTHHDRVPDREGQQRHEAHPTAPQDPQALQHRTPGPDLGVAGQRAAPGLQQWVGPQEEEHDERGQGQTHDREEVGTDEHRQVQGAGDRLTGPDEIGPEHRPDRCHPDDETELTRAATGGREVDRGIPGLVVARRGPAEEQARGEQEREVADDSGDDEPDRAEEGRGIPERETGATPAVSDEGGHRDGEQGGSEDLEGAAETGIGRGAGDVLGEERAHGDPGRQADAAEDLRDDEGGQGAPLDVVDGVLPHPREYAASSGVCRTVA